MSERTDIVSEHPLATLQGLSAILKCLIFTGDMCSRCGFGTRAMSKKWARCKKCGERVERRKLPEGPK